MPIMEANNTKLFAPYRVICTSSGLFTVEHHIDGMPWLGYDGWELIKICGTGETGFIKATTLRDKLMQNTKHYENQENKSN